MPQIVYYAASTLNGFLASTDDSLDWLLQVPQDDALGAADAFMERVGVLVEGSATYEWMLRENDLLNHPERWQEFYGERPTFVFTSRELPLVPGADIRLISGEVERHLAAISEAAGDRDIWVVGGGELAGQFADAGALDEIIVTIAPATLAQGKPFLPRALSWRELELMDTRQIGRFAELMYAVRREGGSDTAETAGPETLPG